MKFFDANCTIGKPQQKIPYVYETPEDLLKSMDHLGIEKTVVSSFKDQYGISGWTDFADKKEFLKSLSNYKDRLVPCLSLKLAGITPEYDDKEYIDELLGEGITAFKFYTEKNTALLPWCFDRIAEQLIKHKASLFYNILPDGAPLSHLAASPENWNHLFNITKTHPELKVILFSPKLPVQLHYCINLMRHCDNVSLDISGFQYWRCLELLTQKFGAEKLIFGSYAPYFEQAQFMLEIVYADISNEDKEKIAWKNVDSIIGD